MSETYDFWYTPNANWKDKMTIEERLRNKGYLHRRTADSANTGRHQIADAVTSAVVGDLTAAQACEFLAKIGG